jgi:putative transposase
MPKNKLFYHFIWSTKLRRSLLDPATKKTVIKAIVAKAVDLGSMVLAVNGAEDHMHLLVSAPPAVAPSMLIGQIKGVSSHLVRHLGKTDFAWQREYGVKTVSEQDVPKVMQYIQNQEKHHSAIP